MDPRKKPEYLIARSQATYLVRGPLGFGPIQFSGFAISSPETTLKNWVETLHHNPGQTLPGPIFRVPIFPCHQGTPIFVFDPRLNSRSIGTL